ncbi:MAG: response regulator transcription factor [Spirochaetota bacterium]
MTELHSLLIVDDERVIREGLATLVRWEDLGFSVRGVLSDGREALLVVEEQQIDVILTDIKMTFVSGLDLARRVREHCPATRVVLLSGHREFELAQQAVSAGVYDYLLKPLDLAQLRRVFGALAATLDDEKAARAAAAQAQHARERDRMTLLQQFYEQVLSGGNSGPTEVAERYRRLGFTSSLAGRPMCIVWITVARRERLPIEPHKIAEILAKGDSETAYVPVMFHLSEADDKDEIAMVAHANDAVNRDAFMARVESAARETVSGIAVTFGAELGVAIGECRVDLLEAATGVLERGEQTAVRIETGAGTSGPDRLVAKAREFLADRFDQSVGLRETAESLGVTPPYLSHLFRERTGRTLIDYLTAIRMERARELLIASDRSVADIAGSVGYASTSHFSRVFKQSTGASPADFRRSRARARAEESQRP